MTARQGIFLALVAFFLGLIFGRNQTQSSSTSSTSSDSQPESTADDSGAQVIKHHWKYTREDGGSHHWAWAVKIKNNSDRRCDIGGNYFLLDKDGMVVSEVPIGIINMGPGEILDATGQYYFEDRLVSAVKGSRAEVEDYCTHETRSTPIQWDQTR